MTIHRLSPKNQVTIPREARALSSLGSGEAATTISHLRGKRHVVRKASTKEEFRVLLLMTELELQGREQRILADLHLDDDLKFEYVTRLNDEMKLMAIDAQNRVVLPAEYVSHIDVIGERDVKFVCTNSIIQIWNPLDHVRYAGKDDAPTYDPVLTKYLL